MDLETAHKFYESTDEAVPEHDPDWYSYLSNPVLTLGAGMLFGVLANLLSRGGGGPVRETLRRASTETDSMATFLSGPYKMVLLVRTDLGMQKGKVAAQCAHAALACYKKGLKYNPEGVGAWEKTGQTKICLKVENEEAMLNLAGVAKVHGLTWSIIQKVGIVAGIGGVYYMAKNLKNKPKDMKLSVYLIHTRLLAQSSVVGVLSIGMIYQMYTKLKHRSAIKEQPVVR